MILQGVRFCTIQGEDDEEQYYLAPSARVLVTQNAVKAQVSYQWNGIDYVMPQKHLYMLLAFYWRLVLVTHCVY